MALEVLKEEKALKSRKALENVFVELSLGNISFVKPANKGQEWEGNQKKLSHEI